MLFRIPVTKWYQVEIGEGSNGGLQAPSIPEARQLALNMTVDQVEAAGTLVQARTGKVEELLPVNNEEEPPFTD